MGLLKRFFRCENANGSKNLNNTVFLAVIASSFIQASWNFYAKKSTAHKSALLLVGWMFFGLISTPLAAMFTDFSKFTADSIFYILLSGFVHCIYVLLLGWAYTVGEISVVYPIARGTGIALTAVFASWLKFDDISLTGIFGIAAIIAGTLFIGLKEAPNKSKSKGFYAAILVGLIVSCYSLVDSRGVQHVPPWFFVAIMNLTTFIFALPIILTKFKVPVIDILKNRKREAFLVASGGSVAYLIILWAFTQSATAYVVGLREFSVVIASLLGIFLLKEELYKRKIAGLIAIMAGALLLKMA